jgi:hypothetical protein
MVRGGRILIETAGEVVDAGAMREGVDARAQVAAALAVHSLHELGAAQRGEAWSGSPGTEPARAAP